MFQDASGKSRFGSEFPRKQCHSGGEDCILGGEEHPSFAPLVFCCSGDGYLAFSPKLW